MISREDLIEEMYHRSVFVPDKDLAGIELGVYAYFTFVAAGCYTFRNVPVWCDESGWDEWGMSVVIKDGSHLARPDSPRRDGPFTD